MNTSQGLALEHSFATTLEGLYAPIDPEGFPSPTLLLLNRPLAEELGLDPDWLAEHGAGPLSGSAVPEGARPLAQVYAGHQFGSFNPQLGDGRALLLGEVVDPKGRRFDLQLKGSGTTPFSRGGDGRAALDSALREYIVSEAMHALGVPTTRALAVVGTGEMVLRDRPSPGAVLTRIAASHLRVGTLEYFASQEHTAKLRRLVDYALQRHHPDRAGAANPAQALLDSVAAAQAELVSSWMLVGFVHGVMNTDNVTLSGETIDYGPCAFMDAYDPKTVFSRIDQFGRYAFGNQPKIGAWNLARMAEALLPLLDADPEKAVALAQTSLEHYSKTLEGKWRAGMRAKLGLNPDEGGDLDLAAELLDWMHTTNRDFTGTFRGLSDALRNGDPVADDPLLFAWDGKWRAALGDQDLDATAAAMDRVNPLYVPRNHKVEEALDAALDGNLGPTERLLEVLGSPFEAQAGAEAYAAPAPPSFGQYQTHCNT